MNQVTSEPNVFSIPPTLRTGRKRKLTRTVTSRQPVVRIETTKSRDVGWEDLINVVMLTVITLVVVGTAGWIAKAIMNQILQYGGFELLQAMSGR